MLRPEPLDAGYPIQTSLKYERRILHERWFRVQLTYVTIFGGSPPDTIDVLKDRMCGTRTIADVWHRLGIRLGELNESLGFVRKQ